VLLPELAKDLAAYRLAQPPGRELVIPRRDGKPWRAHDYRNWRRRAGVRHGDGKASGQDGPFTRAAKGIGFPRLVPYDLRHTFASLLFRDGPYTHAEIARMMGHSVPTLLRVYVHVIEDLRGKERVPANDQIRLARRRRPQRGAAG
jgi:integrase